jgi:hypothetical protein
VFSIKGGRYAEHSESPPQRDSQTSKKKPIDANREIREKKDGTKGHTGCQISKASRRHRPFQGATRRNGNASKKKQNSTKSILHPSVTHTFLIVLTRPPSGVEGEEV